MRRKLPLRTALRQSRGNGLRSFRPNGRRVIAAKVLLRLENDLISWLGSRPISSIEADELLVTIRRVEHRGALDGAHRCLGALSPLCDRNESCQAKPGSDSSRRAAAGARRQPYSEYPDPDRVGELLRAINGYKSNLATCCVLRLAPLVFLRPINMRKLRWEHVNLITAEIRLPSRLLKMRED